MKNINIDRKQIETLCIEHEVENMYLFGSVVTNNFSEKSDIDVLVKFKSVDLIKYFRNYLSLQEKLSKIFGRKVDLVEEQTLKNPILINSINRSKQLIYG